MELSELRNRLGEAEKSLGSSPLVECCGFETPHGEVSVWKGKRAMHITIIEHYSDTEVLVSCARCKGSGRVWPGDSDSRPCWVCKGRGKLLLRVDRLPLVECARCKGSGRLWPGDSDSKECPSCRGAGCQPVTGSMEVL